MPITLMTQMMDQGINSSVYVIIVHVLSEPINFTLSISQLVSNAQCEIREFT